MSRGAATAGAVFLLALCACELTPERARRELADRGIPFTPAEFVQRAETMPLDTLELFLKAGMEPDVRADAGRHREDVTALMVASEAGREDFFQRLLLAGADVQARTRQDDTALMYASSGCQPRLVTLLLLAGSDVNASSRRGETALLRAIPATWPALAPPCATDCINELLAAGANINQRSRDLDTPLHRAIGRDQLSLVRLLLLRRADPNLKGSVQNVSPLEHAVRKDAVEMVQVLLRAGADRNDPNAFSWESGTPRGMAVRQALQGALVLAKHNAP